MGHIIQRFGIRIGRGWAVLLLLAGALIGGAFWIGPLRPLPAELQLLGLRDTLAVAELNAIPQPTEHGIRFAVPLAARNIGARAARPRRLALSVPAQYQLATNRGLLSGEVSAGVPLRRYVIALAAPRLEPGPATHVLPGLDTLYLTPDLPDYYCAVQGVNVPEFVPAPRYDPQTLSQVRIFYSFHTGGGPERHAGLLTVRLDPTLLRVPARSDVPVFRTVFEEPEATAPELGPLREVGSRTAYCGDPEQPLELYTVLWETMTGGRFFVIYTNGAPRKHLYDLNRDGIVELEMWDADGDGRFEARRQARLPTPQFLFPLPSRDALLLTPDSTPPDSAWLALFHGAAAGPWRFSRRPVATTTAPIDTAAGAGIAPIAADTSPVPPADEEFLRRFLDTAAGPFRFTRTPAGGDAAGGLTPFGDTLAPVDTAAVRRAPRRRQPLGTPIDTTAAANTDDARSTAGRPAR